MQMTNQKMPDEATEALAHLYDNTSDYNGALQHKRTIEAALSERDALRALCEGMAVACKDFVDKCDRGEARSVRSYAKFKQALTAYEKHKAGE